MPVSKSIKKKPRITLRFRDLRRYKKVRDAAALKEQSVNKFVERAALKEAEAVLESSVTGA